MGKLLYHVIKRFPVPIFYSDLSIFCLCFSFPIISLILSGKEYELMRYMLKLSLLHSLTLPTHPSPSSYNINRSFTVWPFLLQYWPSPLKFWSFLLQFWSLYNTDPSFTAWGHVADQLITVGWPVLRVRRLMTLLGLMGPGLCLAFFPEVTNLVVAVL